MEGLAARGLSPGLGELVRTALAEDVGRGDVTSEATLVAGTRASASLITREEVCVAGLEVARAVFAGAGRDVAFTALAAEGEVVESGSEVARVDGDARGILEGERVALNFLMRLCGIATHTLRYVRAVEGTGARICDTRKTTPGLRALEKAAVRAGGGVNHRFGLDDGILIKDNHVALAGGVGEAVRRAREGAPHLMKVEVEVEDEGQLRQALEAGAEAVLLDNMTVEEVERCVGLVRAYGPVVIEVSGGIELANVLSYAKAGPDLISCGWLTHSPRAADLSLEVTGA